MPCRPAAPRAAGLPAGLCLPCFPQVQTSIAGLQIADTCFYYPEDRGISESVRFGKLMARAITEPTVWEAEGR